MYYKIRFHFIFTLEAEERCKRNKNIFIKNNFYNQLHLLLTNNEYLKTRNC